MTLQRPANLITKEFNAFKKQALKFKVQGNYFIQLNSKIVSMHHIVDNRIEHQTILQQLHDESSYKRQEGI